MPNKKAKVYNWATGDAWDCKLREPKLKGGIQTESCILKPGKTRCLRWSRKKPGVKRRCLERAKAYNMSLEVVSRA